MKKKSKQQQLKAIQDEIDRLRNMSRACLVEQQEAGDKLHEMVEQGEITPEMAGHMAGDNHHYYANKQRELKARAISLLVEKMRIKQMTGFVVVGKGGRA